MKRSFLLLTFLLLVGFCKAQYDTTYENSFQNWLPRQGWVIVKNDSLALNPGRVFEKYSIETIEHSLGIVSDLTWFDTNINPVAGKYDKIIMTPPITLGNNPYLRFYSKRNSNCNLSVWLVRNINDTTLAGLTDSLLSSKVTGFNVVNLSSAANQSVRIAFRIRGTSVYGFIDDVLVLDKHSLGYIPDSCFRSYLKTVTPAAFIGDSLDYLHNDILNVTSLKSTNGCIKSLEGLQYYPYLRYFNFSNNHICYIPSNTLRYLDSLNVNNNELTYLPDMPKCSALHLNNNLIRKIPDIFNQWVSYFHARNNLIYDCLQGSNRFMYGDFYGNLCVYLGGYTYYNTTKYWGSKPDDIICYNPRGYLSGLVYYDVNKNGIKDDGDLLVRNQRLQFMQGPDIYTNSNGEYSTEADTGVVNLNAINLPVVNPLSDVLHPQEHLKHDLRIVPTTYSGDDLTIKLNSTVLVGHLMLNITVQNISTQKANYTVKMFIPPVGYWILTLTHGNIINDTLTWTGTINPLSSVSSQITLLIDTVFIANLKAIVTTDNDVNLKNNEANASVSVVIKGISWDPNNKLVETPEVSAGYDCYLNYNINFENTGTANTSRVMVRDYLPKELDHRSFEFISSSHPCIISFCNDSVLQFLFQPISLTPKSIDSINCDGHIWFRIKPKIPIQINDTIKNTASIYFDNNPPIVTGVSKVWAVKDTTLFTADPISSCANKDIQFINESKGTPVSRLWKFEGGTPAISSDENPLIHYDSAGNYDVTLINTWQNLTDSTFIPDYIKIDSIPAVTINGPNSICENAIAILDGGNDFISYKWSTNDTTQEITINSGGTFGLTVTDGNGCRNTDSINIALKQLPNDSVIVQGTSELKAIAYPAEYQWMNCEGSLINGATNQDFTATSNGIYFAVITQNGCSDTSDCYSLIAVDVSNDYVENDILIFPNPMDGLLNIEIKDGIKTDFKLLLTSVLGQKIIERYFKFNDSSSNMQWDLKNLSAGIYFLHIRSNKIERIIKVIKQ